MDSQIRALRTGQNPAPTMLIVGDLDGWRSDGRELPEGEGLSFIGYDDLTAHVLGTRNPDIVLSALLGDNFDVIDLARKLESLGFCGRYRALATGVPEPSLIVSEVKQHAAQLDFDILMLADEERR